MYRQETKSDYLRRKTVPRVVAEIRYIRERYPAAADLRGRPRVLLMFTCEESALLGRMLRFLRVVALVAAAGVLAWLLWR